MPFRKYQFMLASRLDCLQPMEYSCQLWHICNPFGGDVKATWSRFFRYYRTGQPGKLQNLGWYTPVRKLLSQCNWLSIRQLIFYHSSLTVYRTTKTGVPVYLRQHLNSDQPNNMTEPNRFPARSTRGIAPEIYGAAESDISGDDSSDEGGE